MRLLVHQETNKVERSYLTRIRSLPIGLTIPKEMFLDVAISALYLGVTMREVPMERKYVPSIVREFVGMAFQGEAVQNLTLANAKNYWHMEPVTQGDAVRVQTVKSFILLCAPHLYRVQFAQISPANLHMSEEPVDPLQNPPLLILILYSSNEMEQGVPNSSNEMEQGVPIKILPITVR